MNTILHVIQQLNQGGATRSLIASSKYSTRLNAGTYRHRVLSMTPADPHSLSQAREAGLEVVDEPGTEDLFGEISQADIVQVHWWNNAVLQRLLHQDLPEMRLIMWYHVAGNAVPQIITPDLVRMADLNVVTHPCTYHDLPVFRYMPPSERSERVTLVVDPADFEMVEKIKFKAHDTFNVGYMGALNAINRHPDYVPMSAGIQVPNIKFVVCGEDAENQLMIQAQELGVADRFDFRGDARDLGSVLETLDICGYPLCENSDPSADLKLQEVMYAGLPVVAFPNGGVKRLLIHEFTGLLVETEGEYQQAIEHLYHERGERERLGQNARQYAAQMLGAENVARKLNPIYERILQMPKQTHGWGHLPGEVLVHSSGTSKSSKGKRGVLSGAQLLVESLGSQGGDFHASLKGGSTPEAWEAEQRIAEASPRVKCFGIEDYRSVYPLDPWLAYWKGLGHLHAGQGDQAVDAFSLAIDHSFPHWKGHWHLARAAALVEDRDLALKSLEKVLKEEAFFEPALELAEALTGTKHPFPTAADEAAASPSRKDVPENDEASELRVLPRDSSQVLGDSQPDTPGKTETVRWQDRGPDLSPSAVENPPVKAKRPCVASKLPSVALVGNLDKAEAARGQKDLPAAWNLTMEAIHERPYHPEAFLFLARIARSAGDMTLARQCAQRASRLAPQWKAVRKFLHNAESGKFLGKKARGFQPGRDLERFDLNKEQHRLSVCLVTYNDEKVIGQCLESIQDLAHQIIVVDLGSTDWTASIAERFGAEIHVREWHDDFSDLRNAALEKATGDWILMLNADEQLSAENLKLLAKHLEDQEVMAWRLPVVDVGQEGAGGRFVPVLYRNAPGLFYVGRIHEQITTSLEMRKTEWGLDNRLGKAQLVCHGIDAESLPHYKKIISDLALLEQAVQELPSDPNLVMNYGLELIRSGDEEKGMERYWEAFHLMASQSPDTIMPEVRETLLNQLVARLLEQREYSAVVDLLQSGPAQSLGLSASLHFSLGMAHMEMRHFDETAQQMRECLAKRDQGALTPVNAEIKGAAPWHALAICHLQQTQTREAEKAFEKALKDDPQSRPVRYDYSSFLAENDQPLVALEILDELVTEDPEDVAAWVRGGQIVLSHPEHARHALEWTVRAVALFPDHPVILWHRAEALLLTQNTQASLEIWERVASPSNARQMAAKILCQLVESKPCATNPGFESAVSQEFLKWYRVLIKLDADQMIQEVNDHISELIKVLPSAGKLLGYALAEARRDAAV